VAEYHRRPKWIAVFLKRNDGTIRQLNDIFPMHLSAASFP